MRRGDGHIFAVVLMLATLGLIPVSVSAERYMGPIIDAHGHLGESFDWERIIAVMDRNNVSRQIVMARYYPGPGGYSDLPGDDQLAANLASEYPGRFFPLVGMQRPELTGSHKWHSFTSDIEDILNSAEEKLASGRFYGIGEVIVRHFSYSTGKHAEIEHPVYSLFMQRLSKIAVRFDVPIIFHMEGDPAYVEGLSRLLRENVRVRYVWSHNCGRSKASVIHSMLEKHPNLYCDLASMVNAGPTGYGIGWPRKEDYTYLIEEDGELFPEMRELYERFADRFMLGMDVAHARGMNFRNYGRRSNRFRELLDQLTPDTATAFAEGNAIRIFKLDE